MEPQQQIKKYKYIKLISQTNEDKPIINEIITLFNFDTDTYTIFRIADDYARLFISFFRKGTLFYKIDYYIDKDTYRTKKYNDAPPAKLKKISIHGNIHNDIREQLRNLNELFN